jgi:hypothetical protein
LLNPALVGKVAGSRRVSSAARLVSAIASATQRSSTASRPGPRACSPTNTSISRYRRARSDSTSACAGESDQSPESIAQTVKRASAEAVTASAKLHPANGRSDRVA